MKNKEFFESLTNKIIQGDCLKVMREIPNDSVDVTFADPPFNLKKRYNSYYDKHEVEEYLSWCEEWLTKMVRITKPTGSVFVHNIPKWLIQFGSYLNKIAIFRHWIAWDAMGSLWDFILCEI
jgi:site-specific DNA-methyltransferase (adenine-specific)